MAVAKAKPVKANIKFRVPAGKATPAPPVGSTLGAHGVNMMDFINAFNDQTKELDGLLNVRVQIFEDRTFTFSFTSESLASQIKKAAGVDKGSGVPNKTKVGKLTKAQVTELAEKKIKDMNANDIAAAEKIVAGQARSMGIEVVE
ncbi:MAG: ribosomal protein large subunit ribosomal protein [Candidatus Saccharibacteria bacterium]|jgi:large subunit ribosomal protein L11|nr:ribosomal protein large subunit ribosomal protein [Candidatus Saccharibacteria bacterium]